MAHLMQMICSDPDGSAKQGLKQIVGRSHVAAAVIALTVF